MTFETVIKSHSSFLIFLYFIYRYNWHFFQIKIRLINQPPCIKKYTSRYAIKGLHQYWMHFFRVDYFCFKSIILVGFVHNLVLTNRFEEIMSLSIKYSGFYVQILCRCLNYFNFSQYYNELP